MRFYFLNVDDCVILYAEFKIDERHMSADFKFELMDSREACL